MSRMYKEYDRQRTDDIDPEERKHYPVSTISGVSDAQLSKPIPKSTVTVKEIEEEASGDGQGERTAEGETTELNVYRENGELVEQTTELNTQQQVEQFLHDIIDDVVNIVDSKKSKTEHQEISESLNQKHDQHVDDRGQGEPRSRQGSSRLGHR